MALRHRFDPRQWAARETQRERVKTNPGNENSVPQIRVRIETLEQAIGLRPIPPDEPTP